MNRRRFLQTMAASTAALKDLAAIAEPLANPFPPPGSVRGTMQASETSIEGHTLLCTFTHRGISWKVYEDLRTRDGVITFISATGGARVLPKSAEAVFAEEGPPYLGLKLKDIVMSARDLLADKLLARGDPNEDEVRRAAPPMDSAHHGGPGYRPSWNTIVGTRECSDTMPVYPGGNTRTYHPVQYFKELTQERTARRHEGLVGGWMPAVCKILPGDNGSHYEIIVFGDVLAWDRFIVQTWHRTAHIQDGKIIKVEYGTAIPTTPGAASIPVRRSFMRLCSHSPNTGML
jgi:hypothetical protein